MATIEDIGRTHLRYHEWAFRQIFAAVAGLPQEKLLANHDTSFGSIYRTLLHVYQADFTWFSRLRGDPTAQLAAVEVPAATTALTTALVEKWTTLLEDLTQWSEKLSPDQWLAAVEYQNSQGIKFRTPIWQVVLHLVNHGTAHRGQVTGMLRQIGIAPPNTDLIRFYRLETP